MHRFILSIGKNIYFIYKKKNPNKINLSFPRQPPVSLRPVAFRPHLAAALIFSRISDCQSLKLSEDAFPYPLVYYISANF